MGELNILLDNNQLWAKQKKTECPDYFSKLKNEQKPEYLWIGCVDSRVPPEVITNLEPGQVLVHRNIANQCLDSDINATSVIQFAVEVLEIKKIIVTGHYQCGGIRCALNDSAVGTMKDWLSVLSDECKRTIPRLDNLTDEERFKLMCELNVKQQVFNISKTPFVEKKWKQYSNVAIYGLIYDLEEGNLIDLHFSIQSAKDRKKYASLFAF